VRDRIRFANVGQELIAETFALRGAGDKARDVDEFDRRWNDLLRFRDRRQRRKPRIRHLDNADIRLDRAERIILRRDPRPGERVEQRRLADVRQADDSAAHRHGAAGDGLVCSVIIARSMSPRAMSGHAVSARSSALTIASRSSGRGGFST
jgi:hypothetical protein